MSHATQLFGVERRFTFEAVNYSKNTFFVVRFEGEEALSELYSFELLLASKNSDLKDDDILNHPASFTLNDGLPDSETAVYHGLVREFNLLYQNSIWTFYRLLLAPKLSRLENCFLSEVYLNKNRKQVFQEIIDRAGMLSNDFEAKLTSSDQIVWNYACQYQETDLNYISRWSERRGIYWWYENVDGHEKVVFADSWAAHADKALGLRYLPSGSSGTGLDEERCLRSLELKSRSLPKELVLMDYNPNRAGNPDIRSTVQVDPNGSGTVYLYGNNLKNNELAQQMATYRAEAIRCRKRQYHGATTATGVRCGHFIEVSGHFCASFNRRYLPVEVRHRGSQAGILLVAYGIQSMDESHGPDFYLAEFTAIPSDVQYRSEYKHPWPKIEGTIPAFIDAEGSGLYAELNENGEYKVQVPFDITDKPANRGSAWIRMATPYAGGDYGMHFPLHKGAEVLLSFINGDPDQPVIVGAITNSLNRNQVVDTNQTQSRIRTAGGNEITLHDQEKKQHLLFKTPIGNTWLRMGSGGSDPAATGYSLASKTGLGNSQKQAPYAEPDGTYNFTGSSADGVTMTTDGAINITSNNSEGGPVAPNANGITLTANSGDISLNTPDGNITATVSGDVTETIGGTKTTNTEGDSWFSTEGNNGKLVKGLTTNTYLGESNSNYIGASNNVYVGLSNSNYLISMNTYAVGMSWYYLAYINRYNFRYDYSITKFEKNGLKSEDVDFCLTNVAVGVFSSNAKLEKQTLAMKTSKAAIKDLETEIKKKNVSLEETKVAWVNDEISYTEAVTKIDKLEAEISTANTKISEHNINMHNGLLLFNP
jgi:type VI secretion system VgrG family protein